MGFLWEAKMRNTLSMMVLFFGMAFIASGVAYAGSCASAEREMVQGQTAVEFAKDQSGYEKAVRLFERARCLIEKCNRRVKYVASHLM